MSSTLRIPASDLAAGNARLHIHAALSGAVTHPDTLHTAGLLTSELVTNAVRHTSTDPIPVTVTVEQEVTVEVWDNDPAPISLPAPGIGATSGRGLFLVDALSTAWGCTQDGTGKVVWFRLPVHRTKPTPQSATGKH